MAFPASAPRARPTPIVHFHLPYTAALGRLVILTLPRRRRPVHRVHRAQSLERGLTRWSKLLNRATVRAGTAPWSSPCPTPRTAALPGALRPRARVVVHGVDLPPPAPWSPDGPSSGGRSGSELGVPDGDLLAVTVANLRSEKGYDVLLEAAGRVRHEASLLLRRRRAGRPGRGVEAQRQALVSADVPVPRSPPGCSGPAHRRRPGGPPVHQEGLPVVLMEATSVGAAIVATTVGGVPQVITDGSTAWWSRRADRGTGRRGRPPRW